MFAYNIMYMLIWDLTANTSDHNKYRTHDKDFEILNQYLFSYQQPKNNYVYPLGPIKNFHQLRKIYIKMMHFLYAHEKYTPWLDKYETKGWVQNFLNLPNMRFFCHRMNKMLFDNLSLNETVKETVVSVW